MLGLILGLSATAEALPFTFTKIVDTDTAIPGGTGNFTSFGGISLDGRTVAFGASGLGQQGIYTRVGGTTEKVADLNSAIPDGRGNFTSFGPPSIDGGIVAFKGSGSGQQGIYLQARSIVQKVADLTTAIPGALDTFTSFRTHVSLDHGIVAFKGYGSGRQGIYLYAGGTLKTVADTNSAMPGGPGHFTFLGDPFLHGGTVVFLGERSASGEPFQSGIYSAVRGAFRVLANLDTAIPAGSGTFTNFSWFVSFADGTLAFKGAGSGQQGIYAVRGRAVSVMADLNSTAPGGGSGNFTFFADRPSTDDGNVAFQGVDASGITGIYTTAGGSLSKVIAAGDSLDGRTISFLGFGREALSGRSIAFSAVFHDGSQGIFVASPGREPSTLVVLRRPTSPAPLQWPPRSPR